LKRSDFARHPVILCTNLVTMVSSQEYRISFIFERTVAPSHCSMTRRGDFHVEITEMKLRSYLCKAKQYEDKEM
jgi:hypothetical protein